MLKNKPYKEWTSEEKVLSLKEYIEKRIEIFPEFQRGWNRQNEFYQQTLLNLSERIEKHKDDEFLNNLLTRTEADFRQRWNKEIKNYEFEKERMGHQLPQLEALYAVLDTANRDLLILFIDLFLSLSLVDWEENKEELNQEKSEA